MRRNIAAILALAVIAVGGYEGYTHLGHTHTPKAAATFTLSSPGSTPTSTNSGGRIALSAIPLSEADLPGWNRVPNDNRGATFDLTKLPACKGLPNTDGETAASAESTFLQGTYDSIISSAVRKNTQSAVATDKATILDPRTGVCFQAAMRRGFAHTLPAGVRLTSMHFRISPRANGAPANLVGTATGTFVFTKGTRTVTEYIGVAFINSHLIESTVTFFGVDEPVNAELQHALTLVVAERTAQA